MAMLNIEFSPIVSDRNYAPERTFITKWDVEIENNRAKKIARTRDRDTKYFIDNIDYQLPTTSITRGQVPKVQEDVWASITRGQAPKVQEDVWEVEPSDSESDDGDGEDTHQGWLRSVQAENDYYDRKYGRKLNVHWYDMNEVELDTDQGHVKRLLDIGSEESAFKRVRA